MSQRRLTAGFLFVILALGVGFFVYPALRLPIWMAIGLTGAAAVAFAVIRNRPRRGSAWWLIVAALSVLTLSEATHFLEAGSVDRGVFPSVADVIYLCGFVPLLILGVWRLVRSGARGTDRAALLDTLIVTTAAAVVSWAFLISPLVLGNTYTLLEKTVAVGYPVSGVLVLAATVRLAAGLRWTPAVLLPVLGVLGMVGSGAAYGVGQLQPGWRVGGLVIVGWLILFAGWGAGALHPAMTEITAVRPVRPRELNRSRLVALATAALIAPLALLIEGNAPPDITVRRALTVALFVFVLLRLYVAVDSQLRGSARERGLRGASASLVEATTAQDVVVSVRQAVGRLFPDGAAHEVVMELGGNLLPADRGPAARRARAATQAPATIAGSIHALDPPLGGQPGIPGAVLRCQLSLPRPTDRAGHLGALYVAADEASLVELEPSVQVLASQAALALERIRLTEEINRHASEEYFRTLVHNATDVILIIDDDATVRYASPSAATVLGAERPGRLQDLVPPEDWLAIERTLQSLRRQPHVPVTADWTVLDASGRRRQTEAVCRDLRSDDTVAGIVITLRDVTEQRRLQQELTHLAFHDPLTGLANRSLLRERLDRALLRCAQDQTVAGILILDVDDLKVVNDTLGHLAGDELLSAAGKRLSGALRQQDTAARLGGDEFAALIVGVQSAAEVEQVAQRVVASFAEPFSLGGQLVSRAVSLGVATTAEAGSAEELMRQADLALYVAKSAGKAQWRRYGEAESDPSLPVPGQPQAAGPPMPASPAAPVPAGAAQSKLGDGSPPGGDHCPPGALLARATGLLVPAGPWMLVTELADAALRDYPITVVGPPPLRVDVSAVQHYDLGSVAAAPLPPRLLVSRRTRRD